MKNGVMTQAASNAMLFSQGARMAMLTFSTSVLLLLSTSPALGGNLLVNPGFESNSGHVIPVGWTYYSPPPPSGYFGNYWVESTVPAQAGTLYWKQWGALYLTAPTNNVAGIYQDFSSAPGSVYKASGWFYTATSDLLGPNCATWIEVSFLGASSNVLALYKSEDFTAAAGADAWVPYDVTQACDLTTPVSTGDPYYTNYAVSSVVSQMIAPVGTKTVRYRFAYLQSGSQGGSCYFDNAVLDQVSGPLPPVISNLSPLNMIFVNPADGIAFNASSPSGFTLSDVHLVVNGLDVSTNLVITGSSSNKTAAYHGLASNMTYNASITVTDALGSTATASTYFETTWIGVPPVVYLWEAEDFDFSSGQYYNNPDLCTESGQTNCYYGTVGVEGVDEHKTGVASNHFYRPDDAVSIGVSGDLQRKNLAAAGRTDYRIDPFISGEWLNYTRDWSSNTYWIYARVATGEGLSGSLTLSLVNADATTTDLGTFSVDNGRGWTSYDNVPLLDTNGSLVNVPLNGKAILRVTSVGNLLPNFFMLTPAQVDLPVMRNLYPTGAHPFEPTNSLGFTITTTGATFPTNGIKLILDGSDVSQQLVVTGSDSTQQVVYPLLESNATHTVTITVTNSLGHGISVSKKFDTFSQDNYMVEAEDFDYDSGQYVADGLPGAYSALGATPEIDFHHTPLDGEQYPYRTAGIPEEIARDYIRQVFLDWGATDYHLAWFGALDWADYTRVYPTNQFHVYARSGGFGNFSMELAEVMSGAGTTNQATQPLGVWQAVGRDNQTHEWVLLTNSGSATPALVKLGGLATLRLSTSTGNCHPSFFMFVPAMDLILSAKTAGTNVLISFPTQTGVNYRLLYRADLSTGSWGLLTNIFGDGSVKSVSEPATEAKGFYKVATP
jgi:hypothetical protein